MNLIVYKNASMDRMRNIMPAHLSFIDSKVLTQLQSLGLALRHKRKSLRISAIAASEAAGMSRVTWHRIEKGQSSVTMGAYLSAMAVLGLELQLSDRQSPQQAAPSGAEPSLPVRIHLSQYPELKRLAWQVHGSDELTPREALDIYERNQRHLDISAMPAHERNLLDALQQVLAGVKTHV
jgi:transcriptional regulator with XRE-family HTH domain